MRRLVYAAMLILLTASAGQGQKRVNVPADSVQCVSRPALRCKEFSVPKPKTDTVLSTKTVVDTVATRAAIEKWKAEQLAAQAAVTKKAAATTTKRVEVRSLKACNLGTQWAINKNRTVLPGEEEFETDRPIPVRINRHRTPTSTDVVWEECILPAHTKVVCSAGGCWVRICGNDVEGVPYNRYGSPGAVGLSGFNCWDRNMNRLDDPGEDVNGDGRFDTGDCQGGVGRDGRDGRDGLNGADFKLPKWVPYAAGALGVGLVACAIWCPRPHAESSSSSSSSSTSNALIPTYTRIDRRPGLMWSVPVGR